MRTGVQGCGQRAKAARPGLAETLDYLRAGDTLVVWRLDRLGRSLSHLIEVVRSVDDAGVGFRALQEQVDTTTAGGKLVFHVFGAPAEFERELIRERTAAGLKVSRTRGRVGGRMKRMTPEQIRQASMLLESREMVLLRLCGFNESYWNRNNGFLERVHWMTCEGRS